MGRKKRYDAVLKVKISFTQDAMLDQLSQMLGLTKSQIVREMIGLESGSRLVRRAAVDGIEPS